jgi:hypothetical protein
MYGGPRNPGDDMAERITDNWIQQNVPGGLNSKSSSFFKIKLLI